MQSVCFEVNKGCSPALPGRKLPEGPCSSPACRPQGVAGQVPSPGRPRPSWPARGLFLGLRQTPHFTNTARQGCRELSPPELRLPYLPALQSDHYSQIHYLAGRPLGIEGNRCLL